MTIISTSYDALISVISNCLTGWARLTNPDILSDNFDSFLRQGWALQAEESNDLNKSLCRRLEWNRNYSLIMSTELFGANTSYTQSDDAIKLLLEASTSVAIAIDSDQTLGITGGGAIALVISDSGIIPIEMDNRKFITCTLAINLKTFMGY